MSIIAKPSEDSNESSSLTQEKFSFDELIKRYGHSPTLKETGQPNKINENKSDFTAVRVPVSKEKQKYYKERHGYDRENGVRTFNKALSFDIQKALKVSKPDIAAAFVLQTLETWKQSRRYPGAKCRIAGAVYLSYERIQKDLPWMDISTIKRAIERLKKAFPEHFTVDRSSTRENNYLISDRLSTRYFDRSSKARLDRSINISVSMEDAAACGVLEAVLIRNLEFKSSDSNTNDPVKDKEGRIYGEMSASILSKPRNDPSGEDKKRLPILPFSRKAIQQAISELTSSGIFLKHPERTGFYTLIRTKIGAKPDENRLLPNAIAVLPNAIDLLPNAIVLSPNAIVYSRQIEEDRSQIEAEIESDCNEPRSPAASAVPLLSKNETLNEPSTCSLDPALIQQSGIPVLPAAVPESLVTPSPRPSYFPRFIQEDCPHIIEDTLRKVEKYRSLRDSGQLDQPVSNDELWFDYIPDPESVSWVENELAINPLTNKPIDCSNFEEQIDLVMPELVCRLPFRETPTKAELEGLRQLFRDYPELAPEMIYETFDRIVLTQDPHQCPPPKKRGFDPYYFARRICSLKQYVRYFKQIFTETFVSYRDEFGEVWREDGWRIRWFTYGMFRDPSTGEYSFDITERLDDIQEPFCTIMKKAIDYERDKALTKEAFWQPEYDDEHVEEYIPTEEEVQEWEGNYPARPQIAEGSLVH